MKIEWVNHASFILEKDDVCIISDPWLEGTVFDNGWGLMSKTKLAYEDFKKITHIWFSHEHPDHFFPPNIKKIPAEYRKNITVLYRQTLDKKVVNLCRELGFATVLELIPYKEYDLSDDFKIMCAPFGHDSWMSYKSSDTTVVNMNDCEFTNKEQLMDVVRRVGKVDLLLTQFSYAGSPGNEQAAREKRRKLKLQAEMFKPRFLIPFASFVWFCHEENYYMNKHVNKIDDMYRLIKEKTETEPVVLYPGDTWQLFDEHDSFTSIAKYNVDFRKILEDPDLVKTQTVELPELNKTYVKFLKDLKENNNMFLVKQLMVRHPTVIYITDYHQAFKVSVVDGKMDQVNVDYDECDVALSSEALNFCFEFPWGWDTLNINGRFQVPQKGNIKKFKDIGNVQLRNSHGEYVTGLYLLGKVKTRIERKIKKLPQK